MVARLCSVRISSPGGGSGLVVRSGAPQAVPAPGASCSRFDRCRKGDYLRISVLQFSPS